MEVKLKRHHALKESILNELGRRGAESAQTAVDMADVRAKLGVGAVDFYGAMADLTGLERVGMVAECAYVRRVV